MAVAIIIDQAVAENVELNAAHTKWLKFIYFRDLIVCDLRTVNDGRRADAIDLERALSIENDGGILVDAYTQIVWVI